MPSPALTANQHVTSYTTFIYHISRYVRSLVLNPLTGPELLHKQVEKVPFKVGKRSISYIKARRGSERGALILWLAKHVGPIEIDVMLKFQMYSTSQKSSCLASTTPAST